MGKGQIISDLGDGQYSVKILNNRVKADKALARIDTWIILNQKRQDELPLGDPEHKLPMLKFSMASLLKQKEYLLKIPTDETINAWCADFTENLTGDVGTIEINGDPKAVVNIRPGYTDNAVHVPARDGQTMSIRAMTPEQAFYNLAMMPGWQKWRPTYRIGSIVSLNGDTCSVRLDDANSSLAGGGTGPLNINQAWDLTDVDIEYMDCNGGAFADGDRVLLQFTGQDFNSPKVIGFEANPKPCDRNLLIVWGHVHVNYWAVDFASVDYYHFGGILIRASEGWFHQARYTVNDFFQVKYRTGDAEQWGDEPISATTPFFIWDLETNDYAADDKKVYWVDPADPYQTKHFLKKTDYPFMPPVNGDVMSHWANKTDIVTDRIFSDWDIVTRDINNRTFLYPDGIAFGYNNPLYENSTAVYIGKKATDEEIANGILDVPDLNVHISTTDTTLNDMSETWDLVFSGKINSLSEETSWGYNTGGLIGDVLKVSGSQSWLSETHAVQINTYRGYDRNTVCQVEERDPDTGVWDITARSLALEDACKDLIELLLPYILNNRDSSGMSYIPPDSIQLDSRYFKGPTRSVGMLDLLDEKRESL